MFQDCDRIESARLNATALQLERIDDRLQRAEVAHLKPGANRLELQLRAGGGEEPGLGGEVWLEIVEPS